MNNIIFLTALAVFSLTSCSQDVKNNEAESSNLLMSAPPTSASTAFTPEQTEQLRAIMKDEAAKAVGAVHLDLIDAGKIVIPNNDPTFVNGVPVAEIDHENSRHYLDQMNKAYNVLCKNWGDCEKKKDGSGYQFVTPKLRYKGYDYLISIAPSHYVLELECMTQSFYVSVLDSNTGEHLEDLWFTVDEKQKLTQPNPAEPAYKGRVSYTRFDKKGGVGTPIPDYGISTLRLSQFLKLAPEVLEHGKVVKV